MESLSASIKQLELERDQVLKQLKEEQQERDSVQNKYHNLQHELANQGKCLPRNLHPQYNRACISCNTKHIDILIEIKSIKLF